MTGSWEGKVFLFVLLETLVLTKKLNDDSVTIYRHLNELKYPFSFTEKMKCVHIALHLKHFNGSSTLITKKAKKKPKLKRALVRYSYPVLTQRVKLTESV